MENYKSWKKKWMKIMNQQIKVFDAFKLEKY